MTVFPANINCPPLSADPQAAAIGMERWREAAERDTDAEGRAAAVAATAHPATLALLEGIFGSSPFLGGCLLRDPAFASRLLTAGPDAAFAEALAGIEPMAVAALATDAVMTALRRARNRVALTVAVGDLAGTWGLESVTRALSSFADRALDAALGHLLAEAARAGTLVAEPGEAALRHSGVFVLGMGKLGAHELNYSSDIDLILLYDEERIRTERPDRLQHGLVRLARGLVRLLSERTADGYVFRTDLRLRPDPSSTPLAMSVHAAEVYYESMGQNWERAAMIKARPVAGDIEAGQAFLDYLRPFVWRRSLDFWAIRDIHSIKRQINAHRGGASIAIAGHNIKLGRGGIREVEFFAQTQQLIWGGRDPSLRARATCEALDALAAAGHVEPGTAGELKSAYAFLRQVEHRLQMVADQQTQTLPDAAHLPGLARFLGYADPDRFTAELRHWLETVETHYAALFEEEPSLGGGGSLVFTGEDDDPHTLETLSGMGFKEPTRIAATVRGWHRGRVRATRSTRAREILTELMPTLLGALARTASPDLAFRNFDAFLARLPAGVQIFSLFHANPDLLDLVAEVMGTAPHLADHMSRHPVVLDSVLTGDLDLPPPPPDRLAATLALALGQARDFQDVLDVCRRWANDHKFQVGVQLLRGRIDPRTAGEALADVAEVVLAALQTAVEDEFAEAHGRFTDGGMAIVAFGKLGSRELTITSDIDLVMVYDTPSGEDASDGAKPLAPSTYFSRLTQRLQTAIATLTGEGRLYEIDLRLRPSGDKGPLAARVEAFEAYERESAWTWEHMALTRARPVSGPPALRTRIEAAIRDVLTLPRDPARLAADVASMRARMAKAHPTESLWAVKNMRGGLIDCEFVAQYLVLRHAATHPELLCRDTTETLRRAGAAGLIPAEATHDLAAATELWRAVQHVLRLTGDAPFDEAESPPALKKLLVDAAGVVDFDTLKAKIEAAARAAHGHFRAIVDASAEAAGAREQETT